MIDLKPLKNLTLLYAEDDLETRELNTRTFQLFFDEVVSVPDGVEALKVFHHQAVHVAALDISMPGIDGLGVAREIRKENREMPVFILTALVDVEPLREAVKVNLVDYLIKPLDFEALRETLEMCLERMERYHLLRVPLEEGLYYDPLGKQAIGEEGSIPLTGKESLLLELLCKNRGRLLEREYLEDVLFKEDIKSASLKNLVYSLRKKLGINSIKNIKESGYLLK